MDMGEYWDRFIFGFCKVEFVCWQGEPNWLGWMVIALITPLTLFFSLVVLGMFLLEDTGTQIKLFIWFSYIATLALIVLMHY